MRSAVPVLVLAIVLGVAACGSIRTPPPDGAAPGVVARAYLDALVAGDCAATRALLANDDNPAMNDLCGIGRVDAYRDLVGPAGTAVDVTFGVTLALRDMPRTSGWPDGDADVFLKLVRVPGGPWRVTGVGSGP
ncbi:MAG TPA: hypothetical protein VES19_09780 [Candidatus Limnocylindrales bacterium]|nr:hypothetical protein [Candidatus Limnocylindrales bacterium]